jgi:GntR family transcriptional regulator
MNAVARDVQKRIAAGEFSGGDTLPGVVELAANYGESEQSVELALGDLVYEGVVERNPENRSQFRVPAYSLWGTITGNHSFTKEARKREMDPGVRILTFEKRPAWPQVMERLDLKEGDEVFVMERLRLADDRPVALEFSYMPAKLYPDVTRDMFEESGAGQSSFKVMQEKFGLVSERAVDELTVAAVEPREAELMSLPVGTPVLIRFRITLSDEGVPIKGSRAIYLFKAGYEMML